MSHFLIKLNANGKGYSVRYRRNSKNSTSRNELNRKRWKHFCRFTTLHGFRDAYDSRSKAKAFVWICLILIMSGLGAYQSYEIVKEYVYSQTATELNVVTEEEPFYPSLRICYPHWLQWLDWDKAFSLGFTRETTLFGLSRLTNIYSQQPFDIGSVGREFYQRLQTLNMSGKFESFFTAIAYDDPPGFLLIPHGANASFQKILHAPRININLMCYELDFVQINQLLKVRPDLSLRESGKKLDLYFDAAKILSGGVSGNISVDEYHMYTITSALVFRGTEGKEIQIDPKMPVNFSYPALFFADGNLEQTVTPSFENAFIYYVRLNGKVLKWLSTEEKPCREIRSHYAGYAKCPNRCIAKALYETAANNCSTYFEAIHYNENANQSTVVCNKTIYFDFNNVTLGTVHIAEALKSLINLSHTCIKSNCLHACQEWVFESQVTAGPKTFDLRNLGMKTFVEVEYPSNVQILVYEEVKVKSWRTFVPDFGGISGLWMGASVLSFFQAVYFFCCYKPGAK